MKKKLYYVENDVFSNWGYKKTFPKTGIYTNKQVKEYCKIFIEEVCAEGSEGVLYNVLDDNYCITELF